MDSPIDLSPPPLDYPAPPLELWELGALLVKHYGLHEGLFDVSVEFQIAIGSMGPTPTKVYPSAMIGVSKLGLSRTSADKAGPKTIDASAVNPLPSPRRRATAKS